MLFVLCFLFSTVLGLSTVSADCYCYGSKGLLCEDVVARKEELQNCSEARRLVAVNASFEDCNPPWELFPNLGSLDIFPPGQLCTCLNCSNVPLQVTITGCDKCRGKRFTRMVYAVSDTEMTSAVKQLLGCFDKQLLDMDGNKNWLQIIIVLTSSILVTTTPVLVLKLRKHCTLHKEGSADLDDVNRHGNYTNYHPFGRRQRL